MKLTSRGELVLNPAIAGAAAPAAPALPDGAPVTAAELPADFSHDGTIRIDGTVTAGGADRGPHHHRDQRRHRHRGDAVGRGPGGCDAGPVAQRAGGHGLRHRHAQHGRRQRATAGDGDAGGAITITALNIVITGSVTSAGGNGVSGRRAGGAITFTSAGGIAASGGIDSLGGEARGDGAATGGNGGAIRTDRGAATC